MTGTVPPAPVGHILAQLFVAFGQGTGTIAVSRAAVESALVTYAPLVSKFEKEHPDNVDDAWDEIASPTLEYARGLGRLAALFAVARGHNSIADEDLENARKGVSKMVNGGIFFCGFCLDIELGAGV